MAQYHNFNNRPKCAQSKIFIACFLLLAVLITWTVPKAEAQTHASVPGELIVQFHSDFPVQTLNESDNRIATLQQSTTAMNSLVAQLQIDKIEPLFRREAGYPLAHLYRLHYVTELAPAAAVQLAGSDPMIELVEPNYLFEMAAVPNDPRYGSQWHLPKVQAPEAWDLETGKTSVIIAIIDSGVDLDHPDLVDNLWQNPNEVPDNGIDDDNNGFVDDVYGWDFVTRFNNAPADNIPEPEPDGIDNNNNGFADDGVEHGSLVAGIAAASGNNGIGVTGMSWQSKIMAVRVLDDEGVGSMDQIIQGVYYAANAGAHIINMSLGGPFATVMNAAVDYAYGKGVFIVAAAGNESDDIDISLRSPACNDNGANQVIAVAATNASDRKASFSNWGERYVDVSAPGVRMLSTTYNNPVFGFNDFYLDGVSGTSASAPVVSGLAALILSQNAGLSPAQIFERLENGAENIDSLNAGFVGKLGAGRVNAFRSLLKLPEPPLTTVRLAPESATALKNHALESTVWIDSVDALGSFQIDLQYNPLLLAIGQDTDVAMGSFLGSTGNAVTPLGPVFDRANGRVTFGGFSFGANAFPAGSGELAKIRLQTLAVGETDLRLGNVQITTNTGQLIPHQLGHSRVAISDCFWADVDCDSDIDIADVQLVAARWGTKRGDAGYDDRYDIDNEGAGDGDIDIVDVQLVASWWGRTPGTSVALAKTASDSVTVFISPDSLMALPGSRQWFTVEVDTVQKMGAFQVDILISDTTATVDSVQLGDFFQNMQGRTVSALNPSKTVRGDTCRITFAGFSLGAGPGASGRGAIAKFRVLFPKTGAYTLWLENVQITDISGVVIPSRSMSRSQVAISENHPPSTPKLLAPADGNKVAILKWSQASDPDSGDVVHYLVQIVPDSFFAQVRDSAETAKEELAVSTFSSRLDSGNVYYWRVQAMDQHDARSGFSETWSFRYEGEGLITDIADGGETVLPSRFALYQNYPNPFNPVTTIRFTLPKAAYVSLTVHNIVGNEVAILVEEWREAGQHKVLFRATDFPSGVYFYTLRAGHASNGPAHASVATRRLILLK